MKKQIKNKMEVVKFRDIPEEEKNKIAKKQFQTAIKYIDKKVGKDSYYEWIEGKLKDEQLNMVYYDLNKKNHFVITNTAIGEQSSSGISLLDSVEVWLTKETDREKQKMLQKASEVLRNALILWSEEEIKPEIQYYGQRKKAVLELTEMLNNTDYKTVGEIKKRLEKMEKLSQKDPEYPEIKIQELKLKTMYGKNEEACFDIDYTNEKYLASCERKLKELEEYTKEKIEKVEKEINLQLERDEVLGLIKKELYESGVLLNSGSTQILLVKTEAKNDWTNKI